jgi:hypothetical protein
LTAVQALARGKRASAPFALWRPKSYALPRKQRSTFSE